MTKLKGLKVRKGPFQNISLNLWTNLFILFFFSAVASSASPLKPEQAFPFQASALRSDLVDVRFRIAPGHYLYRDKIQFSLEPGRITLGSPQFPAGQIKEDPTFGRTEIYRGETAIRIPLTFSPQAGESVTLAVTFQGCADAGLCYPPKTLKVPLSFPLSFGETERKKGPIAQLKEKSDKPSNPSSSLQEEGSSGGEIAHLFKSQNIFWIILSFLGFGLLLSLTPCVFPMIPILSGIILTQGRGLSKKRSFFLSLTYVLGMALTYTAAGMAAALSGSFISGALQNPWVLVVFAVVFILLALSMFGLYELEIPSIIQSKLMGVSNKGELGGFLGVFFMGLLSALIIGPCVTAPLAGALLFIGQTHNIWLGGAALFSLSLGMGIPLLILGTSAGALLPKAGKWMQGVKFFFGFLLLALAFWTLSPLIPQTLTPSLSFQRITNLQEFNTYFQERPEGVVMLYVSADWCTSCKEMELFTFRDKGIQERLKTIKRLKADVTKTEQGAEALLKRFDLFGPPAILFFDKRGQELSGTRIIGVPKREDFLQVLKIVVSG
jgi:thiol:disulfide interchange protein DsbD